jgi:hypothetical protein
MDIDFKALFSHWDTYFIDGHNHLEIMNTFQKCIAKK